MSSSGWLAWRQRPYSRFDTKAVKVNHGVRCLRMVLAEHFEAERVRSRCREVFSIDARAPDVVGRKCVHNLRSRAIDPDCGLAAVGAEFAKQEQLSACKTYFRGGAFLIGSGKGAGMRRPVLARMLPCPAELETAFLGSVIDHCGRFDRGTFGGDFR